MAIKSFLATVEARGTAQIPLQSRLNASEKRVGRLTDQRNDLQSKIADQNRIISGASTALKLSEGNEAAATSRVAASTGDRERASAESDLRSARKLSARSRKTIAKAEKKVGNLTPKLESKLSQLSDSEAGSARLKTQLKAQSAASPTKASKVVGRLKQIPTSKRKTTTRKTTKKPSKPSTAKKTTGTTPGARIPITGTGPVVRKLKLKPGDTFLVKPGRFERPSTPTRKFATKRRPLL